MRNATSATCYYVLNETMFFIIIKLCYFLILPICIFSNNFLNEQRMHF